MSFGTWSALLWNSAEIALKDLICLEPPQTNESDNPVQAGTVSDSCESETVPLGVKTRSWSDWKSSRPWLVCVEGRVFYSLCRGVHNHQFTAVHYAETKDATAFSVNGIVAATAKKLLKN